MPTFAALWGLCALVMAVGVLSAGLCSAGSLQLCAGLQGCCAWPAEAEHQTILHQLTKLSLKCTSLASLQ